MKVLAMVSINNICYYRICIFINLLDRKKASSVAFTYDEMPDLKPVAIKTKRVSALKESSCGC